MNPGKKSYTVQEIKSKLEFYCAYQDRCHQEIEKKLNDYFLIDEARDEIILSLMKDNFLNEERFAKSYARGRFYQKSWGRIKIKHGLKSKGISSYLIDVALKEIDSNDYYSALEKLIEKKKKELKEEDSFKKKQKLFSFLGNKGYEFEIIKELLD